MGESGMENEPKRSHLRLRLGKWKQVVCHGGHQPGVGWRLATCFAGRNRPRRRTAPAVSQQFSRRRSMGGQTPSLDQMKQKAASKAGPSRTTEDRPEHTDLLSKSGLVPGDPPVQGSGGLLRQALQVDDPKNVPTRTKLASASTTGDVDGAISQLQQSLQYDPKVPTPVQPRHDQVAGKKGHQGRARCMQLLLNQIAIERGAQSHGAKTDRGCPKSRARAKSAHCVVRRPTCQQDSEGAITTMDGYKSNNSRPSNGPACRPTGWR